MKAESNGKTVTRKNGLHIRVPVLPDEEEAIKSRAKRCRLSTATYLRNLGLGGLPEEVDSVATVLELCRLNAELNRTNDILKMWLTHDDKQVIHEKAASSRNINKLIAEFRDLQAALLDVAKRL